MKKTKILGKGLAGVLTALMVLPIMPVPTFAADGADVVAIDEAHFHDVIFREYVADEFDTSGDGILQKGEIEKVTSIDVSHFRIESLKGVDCFTSLVTLECVGTKLSELDVSGCSVLEYLDCSLNNLESLDVSKNSVLKELYCYNNNISLLNVSKLKELCCLDCGSNNLNLLNVSENIALTDLWCDDNNLNSLDVSKCIELVYLYCEGNHLSSLDISQNSALKYLYCNDNEYTITLDENGKFDLSTLQGDFDVNCTYNWNGGRIDGNMLSVNNGMDIVTYRYNVNNDKVENPVFTLRIRHIHNFTLIPAISTTCTTAGNNTYYYCADCDKYYKDADGTVETTPDAEIISALGHNWTKTKTFAPTHTEQGYTQYICTRCGEMKKEDYTSKHKPTLIPAVSATCTTAGNNAYYYCADCGKYYKDADGTVETTPAAETIPVLGHNWTKTKTVAPTHTEQGYTLYTCSRCKTTKKDNYTAKLTLAAPKL